MSRLFVNPAELAHAGEDASDAVIRDAIQKEIATNLTEWNVRLTCVQLHHYEKRAVRVVEREMEELQRGVPAGAFCKARQETDPRSGSLAWRSVETAAYKVQLDYGAREVLVYAKGPNSRQEAATHRQWYLRLEKLIRWAAWAWLAMAAAVAVYVFLVYRAASQPRVDGEALFYVIAAVAAIVGVPVFLLRLATGCKWRASFLTMEEHLPQPRDLSLADFCGIMSAKTSIVAFTGAGASADSGIPTFRGSSAAFWMGWFGKPILLFFGTPLGWRVAPHTTAFFVHRYFRAPVLAAAPNACHRWLARQNAKIITQNVDGLHQRAGTAPASVAEIHGTVWRTRCASCGAALGAEAPHDRGVMRLPDACPGCSGVPRPAVTLFGEQCPEDDLGRAADFVAAMGDAAPEKVVLLVGTSGMVSTIDYYLNMCHGRNHYVILVDPAPSEKMLGHCNAVLRYRADVAFSSIFHLGN